MEQFCEYFINFTDRQIDLHCITNLHIVCKGRIHHHCIIFDDDKQSPISAGPM